LLHKLGPHRSLTLPFEPSNFGFKFIEIFVIKNDSLTYRVVELTRLPIDRNFFKPLNKSTVIVHYISGLFFAKLFL
jgi:hypothetical protein